MEVIKIERRLVETSKIGTLHRLPWAARASGLGALGLLLGVAKLLDAVAPPGISFYCNLPFLVSDTSIFRKVKNRTFVKFLKVKSKRSFPLAR